MISLDLLVSGEQLGRELASDTEELAYALAAIARDVDLQEMVDSLQEVTVTDAEVESIRKLAAALGGVKKWGER